MVSIIGFTRPSVQTELDRFFKSLSKSSSHSFDSISKSAFTQSRQKLKPEAFIELNRNQLSFYKSEAINQKKWKQKRVVAIDGSLLNLPHNEEVRQAFGSVKNQHEEVISARCSLAYDVCNELVLDAQIAPRRSCEKDLAVRHLTELDPQEDILIFDRGYPCQWLMGLLSKKGFKYCFRLSSAWKKAHELMSECDDMDWTLIKGADREWGKLKDYGLSKVLEGLRLVSIPLKCGTTEILVTNLTDRDHYSLAELKSLYNLRWGVEEGYKSLKKTLHIEHFTGKSPLAIRQDFHAKVFLLNLSAILRNQVSNRKVKTTSHTYRFNKTQVLAKIKDFLVELFFARSLRKYLNQMLKILEKRLEMVRPNRSFPRPNTSSRRRHKTINYRGI